MTEWPPTVVAGVLLVAVVAGCGGADSSSPAAASRGDNLVEVPDDAETISEALELVEPGGMILVGPGTYRESVTVDRPDVTIRGTDRNATVIDGERNRPYGIVAIADGVRVENLTVTAHTFYGVLVTGLHDENGPAAHGLDGYETFDPEEFPPVQRFRIDHVTAYNNGLYGIYAFNAQNGVIANSYASGSADSGFYVGQCRSCQILLEHNVAERNAIGFENANASDSVIVTGNRFSNNRVGMTLTSDYQEAFTPQQANMVVGNVVSDNAQPESPAQADGGFGIGIGIAGGRDNMLWANRVEGNQVAGLILRNTEDLSATGNVVRDSHFADNGIDVVNVAADRAPTTGTCVKTSTVHHALPAAGDGVPWYRAGCENAGGSNADAPAQPAAAPSELTSAPPPPGVAFFDVSPPQPQPGLSDVTRMPALLPDELELPAFTDPQVPGADLLHDRSGSLS